MLMINKENNQKNKFYKIFFMDFDFEFFVSFSFLHLICFNWCINAESFCTQFNDIGFRIIILSNKVSNYEKDYLL